MNLHVTFFGRIEKKKKKTANICNIEFIISMYILLRKKMYSKTPQSADFGTEQNCTADCEIRRLRVLLYVVNGTEWCITQC
jgi:hypothetical protein